MAAGKGEGQALHEAEEEEAKQRRRHLCERPLDEALALYGLDVYVLNYLQQVRGRAREQSRGSWLGNVRMHLISIQSNVPTPFP